jgi:hypothetical protein
MRRVIYYVVHGNLTVYIMIDIRTEENDIFQYPVYSDLCGALLLIIKKQKP